jgi:hypothetical protein
MEKTIKLTESSDLFTKIDALPLPRAERAEALDALNAANKLAEAAYWIMGKCRELAAWLDPHPTFKAE